MRTDEFYYELPPALIAQHPLPDRDASRLLVLNRTEKNWEHRRFTEFPELLQPGDLLVLNNSKVIPARLRGTKTGTGGSVELLLLSEVATNEWWVMLKPGKRVRAGTELRLVDPLGRQTEIRATVQEKNDEGQGRIQFSGVTDLRGELERVGELPLPPYLDRSGPPGAADRERYQTVFSKPAGSVAAPTAGLHFTRALLERIRARSVEIAEVTLHVGAGTFAPVKSADLSDHRMHAENYSLPEEAAAAINEAKRAGRRVVAAGTTSLRVLESAVSASGTVGGGSGTTQLFVYPPYSFRVVDALLTNFHLPESTLLMLVSAFAAPRSSEGVSLVRSAYASAIQERYRFFSYGDAMFIHS